MFEYVLTLIIILLIVIIFVLVRKEHFSIKETYDDIKTTIKDKISSLTKSNDSDIIIEDPIEDPIKSSLSEVINSDNTTDNISDNVSDNIDNVTNINDIEIGIVNSKYSQSRSTYFTPTLFHPDYVDVINVLNSMTNSPNTVIFNKDGKRTTIIGASENEINIIGDVIEKFIDNVNEKIIKQPKTISQILNVNKWENRPEESYPDGFEEVRSNLGLPKKLYNSSVSGNSVELVEYSDIIVEKVIETGELEFSCDVNIKRNGTRDNMIFRIKFVIEDNKVIIDSIDIIGFNNLRDTSEEYNAVDKFYDYKALNKHNITAVGDILNEMKDKYIIREKLMQDNIDNLHPEDKLMNMRINPYQYESFKATRTIYDDIWEKPTFE